MPPTSSTLSIRSSKSCPPPTRPPTSAPTPPPPTSPYANTARRPHVCPRRLDYALRHLKSADHPPPMSLTQITEALNNLSETGPPERSLSTPSFTSFNCDGDYVDMMDMEFTYGNTYYAVHSLNHTYLLFQFFPLPKIISHHHASVNSNRKVFFLHHHNHSSFFFSFMHMGATWKW